MSFGDFLNFWLIGGVVGGIVMFSFERAMPDLGYAPLIGNIAIGTAIFLAFLGVMRMAMTLDADGVGKGLVMLGIAPSFLLMGILVKTLNHFFPRWSQTPEGKMRYAAEEENHERDRLRALEEKYPASMERTP